MPATIRLKEALDVVFRAIDKANSNIAVITWISPSGDFYVETPETIREIIAEGTWR